MKEKIMYPSNGEFFYGSADDTPLDDVTNGTDESTTEEDVVEDEDSIEDVEEIDDEEEAEELIEPRTEAGSLD